MSDILEYYGSGGRPTGGRVTTSGATQATLHGVAAVTKMRMTFALTPIRAVLAGMLCVLLAAPGLAAASTVARGRGVAVAQSSAEGTAPKATKADKNTKAAKQAPKAKGESHRMSLLPALNLERYADGGSQLDLGSAATSGASSKASRDAQWLELETGWCVAFLGAAPTPEPTPDKPVQAVKAEEEEKLCQLAAGVRYPVAPGANLNLGYQLPNKTWSNVVRPLGVDLSDPEDERKISIGIDVSF